MEAYSYVATAVAASFDLCAALPLVATWHLPPAQAAAALVAGSAAGIGLATLLTLRYRTQTMRALRIDGRIVVRTARFMNRFGALGVGLLAPAIVGATLTCAAGILLGARPRAMVIYCLAGTALWTIPTLWAIGRAF